MSGSRNCADSSILMRAQQCNDGEEDEACCGDGELAEMGCGIPGEAYQVLHKLAGKWTDILDARDLILRPLKGALTNHVYECHWPRQSGKDPRKVLLRVYGEGCDLFFKRKDEILAFQRMSEKGQGPQLLGRFRNGRVEEFLNARTLTALDLRNPEISACIATKLREFHQLDMPGSLQPQLWERLRDWLDRALNICTLEHQEEFHLHSLEEEISELRKRISKPGERVGFCHNDLQYGNIMINERDHSVTIIDYEYASFNPVAFDIANHFCEMSANYHTETPHLVDFSKYPDFQERCHFIESYLKSAEQSITFKDVEELVKDTDRYSLASHLHWGLWGILSASFSDIDFDYIEYARQRFKLYYRFKFLVL
eukprot:c24477_g1_i2 orf=287-1393(-)